MTMIMDGYEWSNIFVMSMLSGYKSMHCHCGMFQPTSVPNPNPVWSDYSASPLILYFVGRWNSVWWQRILLVGILSLFLYLSLKCIVNIFLFRFIYLKSKEKFTSHLFHFIWSWIGVWNYHFARRYSVFSGMRLQLIMHRQTDKNNSILI